jgi:hypothetical protein
MGERRSVGAGDTIATGYDTRMDRCCHPGAWTKEHPVSKIVSPYPVKMPGNDYKPPTGAAWWRFRLQPNADGNLLWMETDGPASGMTTATWCSWEFFDGHDIIIDTGLDRITPVKITHRGAIGYIDVLHVGPPTPSPDWERLPFPAVFPHPEGNP